MSKYYFRTDKGNRLDPPSQFPVFLWVELYHVAIYCIIDLTILAGGPEVSRNAVILFNYPDPTSTRC